MLRCIDCKVTPGFWKDSVYHKKRKEYVVKQLFRNNEGNRNAVLNTAFPSYSDAMDKLFSIVEKGVNYE